MMYDSQPTLIITGAYGSGKTECAMALAVRAAQRRRPVALVDLDFVNPYFRSQDYHGELAAYGVQVIAPDPRVAAIDSPSISPLAGEAILRPTTQTIVDLGGDPAGAVVIGQYAPRLTACDLWAVVNFSRPTTPTPEDAAGLLRDIAAATRLPLTGLVGNTHLGPYTGADDIRRGLEKTVALSRLLAVPVRLLCIPTGLPHPETDIPILEITPRLRRPWESV